MSPEQLNLLQDLVRAAVAGELHSITWLALIVAAFIALASGYFGSYLATKGTNLATKEDFQDLLSQLKAQTHATEEIKARIGQTTWVEQKRWETKHELYTELLVKTYGLRDNVGTLLVREPLRSDEKAGSEQKQQEEEIAKNLREKVGTVVREIPRLRAIGEVFLLSDTISALDSLLHEIDATNKERPKVSRAEYLKRLFHVIDRAHESLVVAAKKDLEIARKEGMP